MKMSHRTKKYLGVVFLPISAFLIYFSSLSPKLDLPLTLQKDETHLQVNFIKADELKEWLEKGRPFLLMDARWPEEYIHGHIPTAVSVHRLGLSNPGYQSSKAGPKEGSRQVPVVFYCNGPAGGKVDLCVRALVRELQNGSNQVYWFKEGMRAWQALGYPVTSSSKKVF